MEHAMFKDFVIANTGTSGDSDALDMALQLALSHDSHVTVMEMVNMPMPATPPWSLMPEAGLTDVYQRLRETGKKNVAALRQRLEKEAVSTEVRLVEAYFSEPSRLAAHYARYADLSVIAGGMGDSPGGDIRRRYFSSLLAESGRPVLVVPPHFKGTIPPRRMVAAWRPTRECARAFNDAMPLLKAAQTVDIVVVDPVEGELSHGEQSGADIATHLARHGVTADVQVRESHDRRIGTVLLEQASVSHADMLVVGGYGHARVREWALGGVTRELLMEAAIPVFFSH